MQLTKQQEHAVENGEAVPIHIGKSDCIVIRKDIYNRVKVILYNDSQMTAEEAMRLGWEAGKSIGWDTPEMAEYDDYDHFRNLP